MSRLAVKLFRAAIVGVATYFVVLHIERLWSGLVSQIIRGLR